MNTGQRLGLVLFYVVLAGYAMLMVRIFVQVLFGPAIEKHRRRQFTEKNGGAAYTPRTFVGKRGWANRWMPRNPEINQPAQNDNSTGKFAGAAPIVKQVSWFQSFLFWVWPGLLQLNNAQVARFWFRRSNNRCSTSN